MRRFVWPVAEYLEASRPVKAPTLTLSVFPRDYVGDDEPANQFNLVGKAASAFVCFLNCLENCQYCRQSSMFMLVITSSADIFRHQRWWSLWI